MSAPEPTSRTLVLLEGPSDVAALTALLGAASTGTGEEALGAGRPAYELVDLGGMTNVGAHLSRAVSRDPVPRVVGLCDAGEARVVLRALQRVGREVAEPEELAGEGFFVCDRDLEDELIRALGPAQCLAVLDEVGLAARFEAFSRQVHWDGRPLSERLHGFSGTTSGRKIMLAGAMARALGRDRAPAPLAALIGCLEASSAPS